VEARPGFGLGREPHVALRQLLVLGWLVRRGRNVRRAVVARLRHHGSSLPLRVALRTQVTLDLRPQGLVEQRRRAPR